MTRTMAKPKPLRFPAPVFGGKSRVAGLIWERLGNPDNYIEPFCRSAAVMLARPHPPRVETVNDVAGDLANAWRATDPATGGQQFVAEVINDLDPHVANVWRSLQADPGGVARWADRPVSELDLHAIHRWLVLGDQSRAFVERMRADPDYFDARRAGYWLYGCCCWIGGGWCELDAAGDDSFSPGRRVRAHGEFGSLPGVHAGLKHQLPLVEGGTGRGVHRQGPRLHEKRVRIASDESAGGYGVHAVGPGLSQQMPHMGDAGPGLHRPGPTDGHRPQLADACARVRGVHGNDHAGTCAARRAWLLDWFGRLRDRLRTVRVCCGDWLRVCDSESVTTRLGMTGVFLDAPYRVTLADGTKNRDDSLYATDREGNADDVVDRVIGYCVERGGNPKMRIAACCYEGEGYEVLERLGWTCVAWKSRGGYASRNKKNQNAARERIWFSPHCLKPGGSLFD